MHNFRAFCFVTVSVCLVVCVSANNEVTAEVATTAVEGAKASVTAVRARAQSELNKANSLLEKVNSFNSTAAQASSQAEEAATDNKEAKQIATRIKRLSEEVLKLYSNAKQTLETAASSLTELLSEANGLDDGSKIQITPNNGSQTDYTDTKNTATDLKGKVDALDKRITTALDPIARLDSTADDMESKAKEAQVKNFHVSTIVAVANIKSMTGEADRIMQTTPIKKNEVNDIIQEIEELKTTAPSGSIESIDKLYKKAKDELTKATSALDRAEAAKDAINQQKELAEAALKNVEKTDIDLETAQQEADKAKTYIRTAEDNVLQLKNEEKTAETSATNAKGFKAEMERALLNAKKKPNTEQGKETTDDNTAVADGTEPNQKDTTIQPTSKDSPSPSDNSADKIKDALINTAHNVPTTALTGGKAPAPGAKNDSAMTLSVPLFVALIASAVLQ